jgi:putative transposase
MPRVGRIAPGGLVYHVMNRGNGRARLFHKPGDYDAFLRVMVLAWAAVPGVRVAGWCLMPNHWHLVLWPTADGELSRFMLRLTTTHVRRVHAHRRSAAAGGHLYQGRFKSFPIEADDHLATVLRYAEANAGRAGLVDRCRDWRWGSLRVRLGLAAGADLGPDDRAGVARMLCPCPVELPRRWEAVVDGRMAADRLADVRGCGRRGRPYGGDAWVRDTAERLGLGFTLRPRGRPPTRELGEN